MEVKDVLFKPQNLYETQLKRQYHDAASKYFDSLLEKSKVDAGFNARHVGEYKRLSSEVNQKSESIKSSVNAKRFVYVLAVMLFVIAVILALYAIMFNRYVFIVSGALIIIGILAIVITKKEMTEKIAAQNKQLETAKNKSDEALSKCYEDTKELNRLFDWNVPAKIMEDATPIIDLDPYFSVERFQFLHDKFGMDKILDPDRSVVGVLSGNIQGNPFVQVKIRECTIAPKEYTGTKTITWTTSYRDSKGNYHTQHHSETLVAHVVRDAPFYTYETRLFYGNEAAPNLTFTRSPSGYTRCKNEADRKNFIKSKRKELKKKEDEAIANGTSFSTTGNEEFDIYFGAYDRNNEVEFRLLFTPLAQQNIVDLICNSPYGDDFYMFKLNMLNIVRTAHSQRFDYSADPKIFMGYDVYSMKNDFVEYCDHFIRGLFFDLAPLLSIPLYQMHMPVEYIYDKEYESNYTQFEQETVANNMDDSVFMPKSADPSLPVMIKADTKRKIGKVDRIGIKAYSFKTTEMVDYVTVHGGDGHNHQVPVYWTKYDKVYSRNEMELGFVGSNKIDAENLLVAKKLEDYAHYERGFMAMCFDDDSVGETSEINAISEELNKL